MKTIGSVVAGREVYHVRGDQTVRDVARYLTERRVGAVAMLEGNRLVGSSPSATSWAAWWRGGSTPTRSGPAR